MMSLTFLGARAQTGASIRLLPLKRFALNGLLFVVMAVPGGVYRFASKPTNFEIYPLIPLPIHSAIMLWILIATSILLREVETPTNQVVQTLHRAVQTYCPEAYSSLQLLQLLRPTDGFHARSVRSSSWKWPAKYKNCFEILPALSLRRNMWSTISGL